MLVIVYGIYTSRCVLLLRVELEEVHVHMSMYRQAIVQLTYTLHGHVQIRQLPIRFLSLCLPLLTACTDVPVGPHWGERERAPHLSNGAPRDL